jgi:predicted dehydrogenase
MELAGRIGCSAARDYSDLIDSDRVDALYIPLPTGLHKEWVNKALLSGKHVYAEKSLSFNAIDTIEMIQNARKTGCVLMEGYMFQFHTQHETVMKLLASGVIGTVRNFSSAFGFPPLLATNFRYQKHLGGGALFDAAGYPLKAVQMFLGSNVAVVGATLFPPSLEYEHIFGSALLRSEAGIGAAISFGFDNYYQCYYQIWGQKGRITVNRAFTPPPDFHPPILLEIDGQTQLIEAKPDNHFVKAWLEFHASILDQAKRECHYAEVMLQSHLLDQIFELGTRG